MNIYTLNRIGRVQPGHIFQMVVLAEDEKNARILAARAAIDLDVTMWLSPEHATCERVDSYEHVISQRFITR